MRIVYVVGTRPNFVKMAPVTAALRRRLPDGRHAIVHTGQHYDRLMSEIFLDELGVPPPDHMLGVGSGSHGEQTARVIERLEPVLGIESPDLVLVPGDVNSTLAAALTAAKMEIRLGHVESGLRSFDRSMPEEINRVVTDQLSDLLFLHSEDAEENLRREGVPDERMHFVGNTMIDTLVSLEDRFRSAGAPRRLGLEPGDTCSSPCTAPRSSTARCSRTRCGVSPRSRGSSPSSSRSIRGRERCSDAATSTPASCSPTRSDTSTSSPSRRTRPRCSPTPGGIQEETTYLGIPCFTLRANTERPVTVRAGTNTVLGLDPARITEIPGRLAGDARERPDAPPLWDGRASERVADVIAG